jgi:uncharacterized protein (DUF885 family)
MKHLFAFLISCVLLISCGNNDLKEEPNKLLPFATFQENYHKERLAFFPMEATFAGVEGYNDLFPNTISNEYRNKLKSFYNSYAENLKKYEASKFSETEKTSLEILKWECEIGLESLKFQSHLMPVDQKWSPNLTLGQFAGGTSAQPFKTVEDYRNWLKRVDGFIAWSDTAIANMKRGLKQGYILPSSLIQKTIPQWEALATGKAEEHLYYSPVKLFPESFSAAEKEELTAAYHAMVSNKIIPMHQRMSKFLKEEYLLKGRASAGISETPNGRDFYQYNIRYQTTTNMTADEIFELGKNEVARIRVEMEKVKEQVGYEGDMKSFFDHVRTNKKLMPFAKPEEVIANFNTIHETMKPKLKELFGKVPKTGFEVRRTEAFRESSASAEYNQGSKDGSRPGIFYVPLPDVKAYNIFSDEALFLHEAIPGHHYQISLQQENNELPEFRKTLWYSAYGEGWALYTESLGKELGLYNDPYQYFGMLSMEIHRAIRLVVDAGMHTKGWTREQAIQYSLENEAEPYESIIAEIERYMAFPGQALAYKIGQLKILQLKEKAKNSLGEKFDIKEFHNLILDPGCIPLAILEQKVDAYIKRNQS